MTMRPRRAWFDLDTGDPAARVVIVGLPYDGAVSLRAGAAAGPASIRAVARTADAVSRRGCRVPRGIVADVGDVAPPPASDGSPDLGAQRRYLAAAADRIAALSGDPIVLALGGDNSVTIAGLGAFVRRHGSDVGIVWFDAHPDLIETYEGNPDSHACALRRALALTGVPASHAFLVGTRSFALEEIDFIEQQRIPLVTGADFAELGAARVAERIIAHLSPRARVYLAIDIDGFDAGCAPGTGYPMPGGIASEAFFVLLERLFAALPIGALDITEVAPGLDRSDVTSFLAAQIVLEVLAAVARDPGLATPRASR